MAKENQRDTREVLIIAYGFPPAGGSFSLRTTKFCKYLPDFDWSPVVLTVKKPRLYDLDPTLANEIPPEVSIYRTQSFEIPASFYSLKKKPVLNGQNRGVASGNLKKIIYALHMVDERAGWIPFCVAAGRKILKNNNNIKLIYVSGKPFSAFIAGLRLKKISGLPLVLDFRDPWVPFNPHFWGDKPAYYQKMELRWEKELVENADKVISVNDNIINDFRRRYPLQPADKFIAIPNGFDPQDFCDLPKKAGSGHFVITYSGALYEKRSPANFFKALKESISINPELAKRLRFRYIGNVTSSNARFFRDSGLDAILELTGVLTYKEGLKQLKESDLLLFIEDQIEASKMVFPSKIFEYIASGVPILALAKNGLSAELVQKTQSGIVVDNDDISGIRQKISDFMEKKIIINPDLTQIQPYSRIETTKALSNAFNSLLRK